MYIYKPAKTLTASCENLLALNSTDMNDKIVLTSAISTFPHDNPETDIQNNVYNELDNSKNTNTSIKEQEFTGFDSHTDKKSGSYGAVTPNEDHRITDHDIGTSRVYFSRWLMLLLFCSYSFSNAFQWIHLNIIGDIIGNYYSDSLPDDKFERSSAVDWLSLVYMLAYIPLIFPATWILDKKGLRICCLCGALLNALGAWLKCASVSPDRFALLMVAQTICAISQIWVLGIPARLAAVWFGLDEVSTATSLGVFGNQAGVAVGFLLPPIIVPTSNDTSVTGNGLSIMSYSNAAFATGIFILICIFFKEKPPQPPSRAQQMALKAATNENYWQSLVRLFKNFGFMILVFSYGINTGSYYALSTLLNSIVLNYFPGEGKDAGMIGLTIVLTGIVGSVLAGIWLDKTKTFKGTTLVICLLTVVGMVAFTFTLDLNRMWIVFVTAGILGFFMTGYLPVGFEFAAELTFPESEGTSSGLLSASATLFGIIFTLGMRPMMHSVSVLSANITLCACLFIGGAVIAIIKPDYRRQKTGNAVFADISNQQIEVNGHV